MVFFTGGRYESTATPHMSIVERRLGTAAEMNASTAMTFFRGFTEAPLMFPGATASRNVGGDVS